MKNIKEKTFKKFKSLINDFLDFIYPPFCLKCLEPISFLKPYYLCKICLKNLSWIEKNACLVCGRNIHIKKHKQLSICSSCKNSTRYFDYGFSALNFNSPQKEFLYQFKYHHRFEYAKFLSTLMIRAYKKRKINKNYDIITFVPIHQTKLKARGFNQSQLLAKQLAKQMKLPLRKLLFASKDKTSQVGLNKLKRLINTKNSYALNINIDLKNIKSILLVDDVITSANTLNECSKIIKQAKPNLEITVFSLMSTPQ